MLVLPIRMLQLDYSYTTTDVTQLIEKPDWIEKYFIRLNC